MAVHDVQVTDVVLDRPGLPPLFQTLYLELFSHLWRDVGRPRRLRENLAERLRGQFVLLNRCGSQVVGLHVADGKFHRLVPRDERNLRGVGFADEAHGRFLRALEVALVGGGFVPLVVTAAETREVAGAAFPLLEEIAYPPTIREFANFTCQGSCPIAAL